MPCRRNRPHGSAGFGRYSSRNAAQMAAPLISPPSSSVWRWTTWLNSICSRRGQLEVLLALEQVGDAALAGLAVDPHDRLVAAADVMRVDRQVGHGPDQVVDRLARGGRVGGHRVEALLDRVLVRAREGRVDQIAAVGVTLVHRQLVAVLDRTPHVVQVGEVDLRVDALAVEVHAQRDQADVAGPLAVAEQAPLDPVGAGQVAQLGGRDALAPVVVRVQRQDDVLAVLQVPAHPLDAVGVDVGRGHLDRRRQVEDHLAVRARLEDLGHLVADPGRELQLGTGVGLRRVLVVDLRVRDRLLELAAQPRALQRDVDDAVLAQAEDDLALQDRRRVVEVHDGLLGAAQRLVGPLDQVVAGLGQHLDGDVIGDQVVPDELADEVEVGLAGRGEPDLDLLVAHGHEQVEHPALALRAHRVDQRLVAVAQVDGAPARGLRHRLVRPGAVGQVDDDLLVEGDVLADRHPGRLLGVVHGRDLSRVGGRPAGSIPAARDRPRRPRRGGREAARLPSSFARARRQSSARPCAGRLRGSR